MRSPTAPAASPAAWMADNREHHPLWRAAEATFEDRGGWRELLDRIEALLREANEDPSAFRTTSRYLLVTVTPAS